MQNSAKSVFGAMILLIQHLPHLHSTVAKREQFYDKFYSKLRHFPHLCSFKFNSKAPLKCFCSKNQTTHEAFQVNSKKKFFMFLLFFWVSLDLQKFLLKYSILLFEHLWYCCFSFQSSTAIFYFELGLFCSATGYPLGQ